MLLHEHNSLIRECYSFVSETQILMKECKSIAIKCFFSSRIVLIAVFPQGLLSI